MASYRIDHIGIAVWSISDALLLFQNIFRARFITGGDDQELGIRILQLSLPPGIKIELMQPINPESYLQRYLENHGQGFHHLTIFTQDVEVSMKELLAAGFEVVDTNLGSRKWRETFLRPRSGFGTLIQIADTELNWDLAHSGITIDDVVAGRVVWRDNTPHILRS